MYSLGYCLPAHREEVPWPAPPEDAEVQTESSGSLRSHETPQGRDWCFIHQRVAGRRLGVPTTPRAGKRKRGHKIGRDAETYFLPPWIARWIASASAHETGMTQVTMRRGRIRRRPGNSGPRFWGAARLGNPLLSRIDLAGAVEL